MVTYEDIQQRKIIEFSIVFKELLTSGSNFLFSVADISKLIVAVGESSSIGNLSEDFAAKVIDFMKTTYKSINTAKRVDNLLMPISKIKNVKLLDKYLDHLKEEIIYNQGVMDEVIEKINVLSKNMDNNIYFFLENTATLGRIVIACGNIILKQNLMMHAITKVEFSNFYLDNVDYTER